MLALGISRDSPVKLAVLDRLKAIIECKAGITSRQTGMKSPEWAAISDFRTELI